MNRQAPDSPPNASDSIVNFVVRTSEIALLAAAFWIAARRAESVLLWCIAATLVIVLMINSYSSGMRLLEWIQNTFSGGSRTRQNIIAVMMMLLLFVVTGLVLYGTTSVVAALVEAEL